MQGKNWVSLREVGVNLGQSWRMESFQVRTGFVMMWVVPTKRTSGVRNGQAGDKWLAGIRSWAARLCWEMKVGSAAGWSEKCGVR